MAPQETDGSHSADKLAERRRFLRQIGKLSGAAAAILAGLPVISGRELLLSGPEEAGPNLGPAIGSALERAPALEVGDTIRLSLSSCKRVAHYKFSAPPEGGTLSLQIGHVTGRPSFLLLDAAAAPETRRITLEAGQKAALPLRPGDHFLRFETAGESCEIAGSLESLQVGAWEELAELDPTESLDLEPYSDCGWTDWSDWNDQHGVHARYSDHEAHFAWNLAWRDYYDWSAWSGK